MKNIKDWQLFNFLSILDDVNDIVWHLKNFDIYPSTEKFGHIYSALWLKFILHVYAYTDAFKKLKDLKCGNPFSIWKRWYNLQKHSELQANNFKFLISPDGGKHFYKSGIFSVIIGKEINSIQDWEKGLVIIFILIPSTFLFISENSVKYNTVYLKEYWEIISSFFKWIKENKKIFEIDKVNIFDAFILSLSKDKQKEIDNLLIKICEILFN